ncbi:MAG: sigma-54 dependent transcriptional regulator [Thermodesulfobacteriota bacterium]
MAETKVLIVDDDKSILLILERLLSDKELTVVTANNGKSAARLLASGEFTIALLDINIPDKSGLELLKDAKEASISTSIIIMTAEQTMTNTLEAMKRGAFDYITKPFDLSELEIIVERAIENDKLVTELSRLKSRLKEKLTEESTFIGKSRKIQNVFKTVGKISLQDVTVLLVGESGTGKELLAKLIHTNSKRAEGPFIPVNTAAVPKELMESELFGFEKGAFTGATERTLGKFELSDGGTIFLDEVGDMSLELQSRLLRIIQEREFYRIGGKEPVKIDTRIIAATNQDIEKLIDEKKFREDLYFRLNVVKIKLPPLRERKSDIPLLSEYFLKLFHSEMDVEQKGLTQAGLKDLESYPWPGNVRELENVLRRAVLLCPNIMLSPDDLKLPQKRRKKTSLEDIITERLMEFMEKTPEKGKQELYDTIIPIMERPLIKLVLQKTRANQVHAAELLGINRNTLRKKIKELKIDLKEIKE